MVRFSGKTKPEARKNVKGMPNNVKGGGYETPTKFVLAWVKTLDPNKGSVAISLDKLTSIALKGTGISNVSAYLFLERWSNKRIKCLNEIGELIQTNDTLGTYRFHFHRPKPQPTKPFAKEPEPGNRGPVTETLHALLLESKNNGLALNLLMEAVGDLTDKVNAIATKK